MRAARRKGGSVMSRKCIGIDIGGTTVKLGMFEQDGTLLAKWEIPTRKENGGAHILEDIAAAIKKKAAERGLSTADFEGARAFEQFLANGVRFRRVFRRYENGMVEEAGHDLF